MTSIESKKIQIYWKKNFVLLFSNVDPLECYMPFISFFIVIKKIAKVLGLHEEHVLDFFVNRIVFWIIHFVEASSTPFS